MPPASDPTAIILSMVAVGISVLALAFSAWQAVTAHLARTTPLRASFALIHPQRTFDPVLVHNTGGSAASSVEIVIIRPLAKPELRERVVPVPGVVGAGQSVPLLSTRENNPFMVGLWIPDPEKPGTYNSAPEGTPDGVRMVGKWARVKWTDWRGKRRKGRIPLW